jgi:hypothetical protein
VDDNADGVSKDEEVSEDEKVSRNEGTDGVGSSGWNWSCGLELEFRKKKRG